MNKKINDGIYKTLQEVNQKLRENDTRKFSVNYNCGLKFTSILTIIFVIAKITGYINWSWWLVFLPILITPLFWLGIVLIAFLLMIVSYAIILITERK